MALALSLSYSERNDNRLLTLTDTTTNWNVDGNIAVTGIISLTLDVTIVTSDNTETVYDQIDLYDIHGGFTLSTDLVFPIDCSMLEDSGTALGAATDELPDGVYTFTYIVNEGGVAETSYTEDILVEGKVRVAVYELLRTLPTTYSCTECKTKEIMDAIFCYGLLNSMESAGYVAKNEELITQLYTLERLVTNGSSYTW
jgi:hypothetical protein